MSQSNKSFFSGLHLFVTGLAALITAAVAVTGLAFNQGWVGGHAKTNVATAAHGAAGSSTTSVSDAVPTFAVDPTVLTFQPLGPTDAAVTVRNTGLVPVVVQSPTISGVDQSRFAAGNVDCSSSLDPGRSCQMKVTFSPSPGTFHANLVVQVAGAPQAIEVPIVATAIL